MNRRQFLNSILLSSCMPLVGLNRQALAHPGHDINSSDASHPGLMQRRLVLVELAGANDGLNTLVPYTNDHYHTLRPTIGLSEHDVIKLNDELGLHSALQPLMPVWEQGELAVVQGLGYPKANRSHFKSIALWESAGDGILLSNSDGWMTHAIEHHVARKIADPHGISLSGSMSLFSSETGRWLSVRSLNDFKKSVPDVRSAYTSSNTALNNVQKRFQTLDSTLDSVASKLAGVKATSAQRDFGGGQFGKQLQQVSTMVAAGVDTPVYRVKLSGFDTHKNQQGRHNRLLSTLAAGLADFSSSLRSMNEWNNTVVMTYSEFGRRASENRSSGTDHGTAAPHFVMGGDVGGGLYGKAPDLARLHNGDPEFTMDYRALYHSMLVDGLGADGAGLALTGFADSTLKGLLRTA